MVERRGMVERRVILAMLGLIILGGILTALYRLIGGLDGGAGATLTQEIVSALYPWAA